MKHLVSLSLSALLLTGCAPPLTKADVDGLVVCNGDRMDRLEREARREHKEIHWVRCPQATLRVAS